ncbi:MAG TPA: pyruvate kinase, partial [Vicinamibacteria bacterium]|nr:pyruvate kinase [Vicinamibacteria bacterium]
MRRTKIVATIGPASRDPGVLERLIQAGVDVARLNFSHGSHEDHLAVMRAAREIAARLDRPVALLQDLSGPKIRTGRMKGNEPAELKDGARVRITTDLSVEGTAELISTTYEPLPHDLVPGDQILLDDGNIELKVVGIAGGLVDCEVVDGGILKPGKGMNLPGARLSTPALTEKDRKDLAFGVQNGVDYVALSFVRRPADVLEAKALIRELGGSQPLIAKIEKREAIEALDSLLEATDGVMVARGDLGVEVSTESVPTLQKQIIKKANALGKAVITATQMLESMIDNPRPTRAEASDVANAILDGTDAVMLSAESASGRYPVEAVATMARIADFTEEHYGFGGPGQLTGKVGSDVARSLARVASTVAEELGCKLIVCFTESGATARVVSAFRPRVPIAAVTHNERVHRQLALWWGVVPVKSEFSKTTDEMVVRGEELLKRRHLAASGERVVML